VQPQSTTALVICRFANQLPNVCKVLAACNCCLSLQDAPLASRCRHLLAEPAAGCVLQTLSSSKQARSSAEHVLQEASQQAARQSTDAHAMIALQVRIGCSIRWQPQLFDLSDNHSPAAATDVTAA
jgi:hypothetical protein